MVHDKHDKISLLEEARSSFHSLGQQTATVFIGFLVMLLIAGGAPSSVVIALSVALGIFFVAWREHNRFTLTSISDETEQDKRVKAWLDKSSNLTKTHLQGFSHITPLETDEPFASRPIADLAEALRCLKASAVEDRQLDANLVLLEQRIAVYEAAFRELQKKSTLQEKQLSELTQLVSEFQKIATGLSTPEGVPKSNLENQASQ